MIERLRRPARGAAGVLGKAVEDVLNRLAVEAGQEFVVGDGRADLGARARRDDPDTSKVAARSLDDLRESQRLVLSVFDLPAASRGLTDEQLIVLYEARADTPKQSHSGLRSRRSELVAAGFLRDSLDRREISTGRQATVWALVPRPANDQEELFT